MEEDGTSERAGLGFQPPAQAGYSVDPHAAMADAPAPSTPPVRSPELHDRASGRLRSQWRNLHPRHLRYNGGNGVGLLFDPNAYPVHTSVGSCQSRPI